ncbi:MAG TPA: HAD hydrolase-like protein, partial [Ktedonobacteraceae bacterium]|nr:HAD hydrolase-like protein [Ktedonobacteraceae bacterium]
PQPGMLLRACQELNLDLTDAVFVGDSITDIRAGLAAGVQCILVLTGLGLDQLRNHYHEADGPFIVTASLPHAAEAILQGLHVLPAEQHTPLPVELPSLNLPYQDMCTLFSTVQVALTPD